MRDEGGIKLPEKSRRERKIESDHWWDRQHSLVLRQTPRWAQALTLGLFLLGSGAITASIFIKIDEVITVTGKLIPTEGVNEVMTPAGGLVKDVLVKEGQLVKKGDKLVEFDTRKAVEEIRNIQKQLVENDKSYQSGQRAIITRRDALMNSLDTNISILERMEKLKKVGAIEQNSYLRQQDQVYQIQAQVQEIEEQLIQSKSNYERNISDLKSRLSANKIQKQYETVEAPITGIVFDIKANESGVLSGGQQIMKLVSQSNLKANVSVTNKDIGFIRVGQKTKVRIDAFNFTQFGVIDGEISSIGADVMKPDAENRSYRFPVTITLNKNYLETKNTKIPVVSGMSVTANIKLREKRLISVVNDLFNSNYDALKQLRQ